MEILGLKKFIDPHLATFLRFLRF